MDISPNLSAIMCDGMGWFSALDYKRMLLTYDQIYYLLPKDLVPFHVGGKEQNIYFPIVFRENPSFKVHYFSPDDKLRQLILASAHADLNNPKFAEALNEIPEREKFYTWKVVNADGDVGSGHSLELDLEQKNFAHSVLLNKFLLAANALKCIPITGKPYIHGLISEKYNYGVERLRADIPDMLPSNLKTGEIKHNPIVSQIITALVPDDELEKRSETEIMQFKERNKVLFQRYSYTVRQMVGKVSVLPMTNNFDTDVDDLIKTEVWKEKIEIEKELRSAWEGLFKSVIKSTVAGLVGVGIVPFLSLGAITWASVATASIAISPWVTSQLIDFIDARKKAQEHGLYYLMKFSR
jgi:hypothetical protein